MTVPKSVDALVVVAAICYMFRPDANQSFAATRLAPKYGP